jgi:hypothetical protein
LSTPFPAELPLLERLVGDGLDRHAVERVDDVHRAEDAARADAPDLGVDGLGAGGVEEVVRVDDVGRERRQRRGDARRERQQQGGDERQDARSGMRHRSILDRRAAQYHRIRRHRHAFPEGTSTWP